ncbi:MAG: flagellar basal body-associated FliL family protein [Thermodesulfobacteriota bacterium]
MAEEPRPDPSVPKKNGGPAAEHPDTDWGADWESAFQAEDDTFFTSADEEFFLEEEPAKEAKPAADEALEKSLAGTPPTAEAAARPAHPSPLASLAGLLGRLRSLPTTLLALPQALWQRFAALPLKNRLVFLALGLLVPLAGGAVTLWLTRAPEPQVAPPPSLLPAGTTEATTAPAGATPAVPDKVRKKVALAGFLIPVKDDKGTGPLVFIRIDLTLNTLLGEEEELGPDEEAMARDIIYQFFTNHTLSELRRYQLARGDLQRDLRAWLERQWPEAPVESITFSRYQLG